MGRFTKVYVPAPLVLVVRVSEVFSSTRVTPALGMTPPDGSVTSPVMPPRVCCADRNELHSAMAARIVSSWGKTEETNRMECLNVSGLENRDFPIGLLN